VSDFFAKSEDMFAEMNWQKKLRNNPALFGVSSHMSLWSNLIFYSSLLINAIGRPSSAKASLANFFSRIYIKKKKYLNLFFFLFENTTFLTTFLEKIPFINRVADPHHFNADPHHFNADPHHFNADPDPDPDFHFNADLDLDPAPCQSDANLRPLVYTKPSRAPSLASTPSL
jgi:hypothetical protein